MKRKSDDIRKWTINLLYINGENIIDSFYLDVCLVLFGISLSQSGSTTHILKLYS